MFKGTKIEIEIESDEVVQGRASENVENQFAWFDASEGGRSVRLLNGRPTTTCRKCDAHIVIPRPWSINDAGHVVVARQFAEIRLGDRSVREEVEPTLCPGCFKARVEKIVTPRPQPVAPEKPKSWHIDGPHGRLHGIGDSPESAWSSMDREARRQVTREQFLERAEICTGV